MDYEQLYVKFVTDLSDAEMDWLLDGNKICWDTERELFLVCPANLNKEDLGSNVIVIDDFDGACCSEYDEEKRELIMIRGDISGWRHHLIEYAFEAEQAINIYNSNS